MVFHCARYIIICTVTNIHTYYLRVFYLCLCTVICSHLLHLCFDLILNRMNSFSLFLKQWHLRSIHLYLLAGNGPMVYFEQGQIYRGGMEINALPPRVQPQLQKIYLMSRWTGGWAGGRMYRDRQGLFRNLQEWKVWVNTARRWRSSCTSPHYPAAVGRP